MKEARKLADTANDYMQKGELTRAMEPVKTIKAVLAELNVQRNNMEKMKDDQVVVCSGGTHASCHVCA